MSEQVKTVDGFRFLPPSLGAWIKSFIPSEEFTGPIPWTLMVKPLHQATLALVTSAGISHGSEPPFDMEREKREPTRGDRSFRMIPRGTTGADVSVNHLHIDTGYIRQDINVMLPLERMAELERQGAVGRLAQTAYSFYGFQWGNTEFIESAIAPMAARMRAEGVDAVFLTPA